MARLRRRPVDCSQARSGPPPQFSSAECSDLLLLPGDRERPHQQDVEGQADAALIEVHWHGEDDQAVARPMLVKGLLPERGKALVSGQWGTFKTFVVLDLAGSVMTGWP